MEKDDTKKVAKKKVATKKVTKPVNNDAVGDSEPAKVSCPDLENKFLFVIHIIIRIIS